MPRKPNDPQINEWVSAAFKGLVVVVFTIATAAINQLNTNISSLTNQLKSMESHQIETDKRVSAIEISRQISLESYKKVVGDVEKSASDISDIKAQLTALSVRTQTIADFVARRAK